MRKEYLTVKDIVGPLMLVDTRCNATVDSRWSENRRQAMSLLKREAELEEIVRLVGMDSLAPGDRLLLEGAKMVREDFLHQNAFEPVDTYSSLAKQFRLLDVILTYYHLAKEALDKGTSLETLLALPVKERIARAKLIPEDDMAEFDKILGDLKTQVAKA